MSGSSFVSFGAYRNSLYEVVLFWRDNIDCTDAEEPVVSCNGIVWENCHM